LNVVFDPAKDACNLAKQGFSWLDAVGFEGDSAVVWPDLRHDDNGARLVALGCIGWRIMALEVVDRLPEPPTERRIISLGIANSQQPSGETICRTLKLEPSCRHPQKMPPALSLR
jgi:uncharacterized DUF497 family protein